MEGANQIGDLVVGEHNLQICAIDVIPLPCVYANSIGWSHFEGSHMLGTWQRPYWVIQLGGSHYVYKNTV